MSNQVKKERWLNLVKVNSGKENTQRTQYKASGCWRCRNRDHKNVPGSSTGKNCRTLMAEVKA